MQSLAILLILVGVVFHALALFTPGIEFVIDTSNEKCMYYSSLMTSAFVLAIVAALVIAYQTYQSMYNTNEHGRVCRQPSSMSKYSQPVLQLSLVLVVYLQMLAIVQSNTLTTCRSEKYEARIYALTAGLLTTAGTTLLCFQQSAQASIYLTV